MELCTNLLQKFNKIAVISNFLVFFCFYFKYLPSCSVADPDPHGFAFKKSSWIRIQIQIQKQWLHGHPIFELWNRISQRNQQISLNRFFLFSCGPYLHGKTQNYPVEGCSKRIPHLGLHHVHGHVLFKKHRFESPFQMRILQPVKYLRHFRCEAKPGIICWVDTHFGFR